MDRPPNNTVPSNGGLEKQTAPVQGKQDAKGNFQSNEITDSFGEPWNTNERGQGLARALQGKPFELCKRCGKGLAAFGGMDNHACATPYEYNADLRPNIGEVAVPKRN